MSVTAALVLALSPQTPVPAVAFAAIENGPGRVVFENRDNDFPQRVLYSRAGDRLTARIEGHVGDRDQAIDWHFHKAELNARCPV